METIDNAATARARGERFAPDYSDWTVEELRLLALQLRVRQAAGMTRGELLEVLAPPARLPSARH